MVAELMDYVEFFQDEAGEYRFRIKGRNGEIMVSSEGYSRAASARRGVKDLFHMIDVIKQLPEGRKLGV